MGQGTHAGITVMKRCKWAQTVIPQKKKKVLLWTNDIFGSITGLANLLWSGTAPLPFVFCILPEKKNTWSLVHDYLLELNPQSQVSDTGKLRIDWLELNKQLLTHYTHAKQDLPPKFELMTSWVNRASISSYWISASSKSPSISNTNASSSWKQTTKMDVPFYLIMLGWKTLTMIHWHKIYCNDCVQ